MRDTSGIGNRSAGIVLAALLRLGKRVLLPFGDGQRYDLVIDDDDDGVFQRVQCKTGRLIKGAVVFSTASQTRTGKRVAYTNDCDLFGIYCPPLDKVYLVPVRDVPERTGTLRITAPKNGQERGLRMATRYEIQKGT